VTAIDPGIFRKYDIRGNAARDLTDPAVNALGRAYGSAIRERGGRSVALGRDCRLSGPRIHAAFGAGVRAAGVDVVDIGMVPTPLLYFSLHHLPVDGGVIITGSHNPPAWNGFKLCAGTGSVYGDAIQDLRQRIETERYTHGSGSLSTADVADAYQAYITRTVRLGDRPLTVAVDAGNGTGGIAAPLYRALGATVIDLFCDADGTFPNHHPDPTVEANLVDLRAAVATHGCDMGIAFDGDSDRIGAIDSTGEVIWGDQLLLFFARALLKTRPNARIVGEVKCSKVLYDGIRAAGGTPEMWKVGHSLIKARMKATGAPLAGEMSGHLFFADRYFGFDDAIYAGARLMELISRSDVSLADMRAALPKTICTPELRVACPDAVKFDVAQRAAAYFSERYSASDIDGVRIEFEHGWGLVRPSNTQPVLVMRFEADTPQRLTAYRSIVEDWLRATAPEVDFDADTHH
jgi:phosphomannomutase/phosphoglucomutase